MQNGGRMIRMLVAAAAVVGGIAIGAAPASPVAAASKVTICHRTHSTTNPYRRITVSVSSVNGSSANDHTHHTGAPFDPTFSYPPNAKIWGDIIPDNASGGAGAGLNWSGRGIDIYQGNSPYGGLCGAMSAQQFYDLEVANGVDPAVVLQDLDEQAADEDLALLSQIGSFSSPTGSSGSFTPSSTTTTTTSTTSTTTTTTTTPPPTTAAPTTAAPTTAAPTTAAPTTAAPTTAAPTTAAPTTSTASTTTTAPTTTTPAPTTTAAPPITAASVTSRVEGIAWIDANRNGSLDPGESRLPGIVVALEPTSVSTRTQAGFGRSRTAAAPLMTTLTGADGSYSFPVVTPGEYVVVGQLNAPGLQRTWDTDGAADWHVDVVAPAGGVGRADVAAVGEAKIAGTVVQQGSSSPIANALVSCRWAGVDGIDGTTDDVLFSTIADAKGTFSVTSVPFGGFVCGGIDPRSGSTSALAAATVENASVPAAVVIPVSQAVPASGVGLPVTGSSIRPLLGAALVLIGLGLFVTTARTPSVQPARVRRRREG